ncbi:MAG TPA: hypothetical protein VGH92_05425 [Gaiellaceae bacterium]|jgi:DNA-binding beta-propeller fold protein YncE
MDRRVFLAGAAALVAAPRAFASLRERTILVTADLEAHLVALDTAGRVVARVPTPTFPRSIESVGDVAVVCHSEIGAVSIVDRALRVRHVLHGFGEPRYTAGHPDGRHAYVTDARRGQLAVVDVLAGRVVGWTDVGHLARHITLDPDARTLWVALGSKAAEVAIVDVRERTRPRLIDNFRPPFLAHDVGFAPDGRHAWVSSGDRQELAVYESGRVVALPSSGWPPQHVTFDRDRAYVTSGWNGRLNVHTLEGRLVRLTPVEVGSYNVQQTDGLVVTPSLGRGIVTVLDERGDVRWRRTVARSCHDACVL